MYNQILYFIVALLVFTVQQPGPKAFLSPFLTILASLVLFGVYAAICRQTFKPLRRSIDSDRDDSMLTRRFHAVQSRLSILGLVSLAGLTFGLNIKYYLQHLPGLQWSETLTGAVGLSLYLLHLSVIWILGYPVYRRIHHSTLSPSKYLWGSASFQTAILIPWILISLISDVLLLVKKPAFFNSTAGQVLILAIMLGSFISFGPSLVVRLWGCKTLPDGSVRQSLEAFCARHGFRVGDFKLWPLLGGEMLTAGIMGILPGLRYILITRGLLSLLDREELEAVVAHEMGHVKRFHLPFYLLLFLSFFQVALSYHDLYVNLLSFAILRSEPLLAMASKNDSVGMTLVSIVYMGPILLVLILFFRFIFGFFMRNSERQADLYALKVVGHPYTLISSLEKIAHASGRIHDLPSWHHYSIRERTDFLWQSFQNPRLPGKHDGKLYGAAAIFLLVVAILAWASPHLEQTVTVRQWHQQAWLKVIETKVQQEPDNPQLQAAYGSLLLELKQYGEAEIHLLRALELTPEDPVLLNNLAWLYATAPQPVANATAALELAKEAVQLRQEPFIWDTLAEAYYVNGLYEDALQAIDQAIRMGSENGEHYMRQKEKLEQILNGQREGPSN
jgi:Zn-dependent protease with chaperone function